MRTETILVGQPLGELETLRFFWNMFLTMREFLLTQSLKLPDPVQFSGVLVTCGLCCARPGGRRKRPSERRAGSETSTGSPQRCR
jgi:hypothetical protein